MPAILEALFFTAAVICFLLEAFWDNNRARFSLIALGLALFAMPFAFDAWAAVD